VVPLAAVAAWTTFGSLPVSAQTAKARTTRPHIANATQPRNSGHHWVASNKDGRQEVFDLSGGAIEHAWQTAPNIGWSDFSSFANPTSVTFGSDPVVARNADGRLEVFTVDDGGGSGNLAVWHNWQTAPNAGWAGWASLGNIGGEQFMANTNVAVGVNADGRLDVFGRDATATGQPIVHRWQTAPNGGWSGTDFVTLATQPEATTFGGDPTVARNKNGRLELFVIDNSSGHNLWHIWQTAPNSGWSAYNNLDDATNFAWSCSAARAATRTSSTNGRPFPALVPGQPPRPWETPWASSTTRWSPATRTVGWRCSP
jgi:hypothetical protein